MLKFLFAIAIGFLIGLLFSAVQSQPKVICEDGAEYRDVRLFNDPYYKYSIACNLGNANGPLVVVEVID